MIIFGGGVNQMKKQQINRRIRIISLFICLCALIGCDKVTDSDMELMNHVPKEVETYQEIGLREFDQEVDLYFVRGVGSHLKDLIEQYPDESVTDNRWSRLYHDVLGINVKYKWLVEDSVYNKKFASDLMSGDLPDVMRVNIQQFRMLYNAGLIQDLTEVYQTYATSFTKSVFEEEGSNPFEAVTINNQLMGIPDLESSTEKAEYLWIRTDWLETLGLSPPENMAEVVEISKRFTNDDPNQNGKNDTYGLAFSKFLWDPIMGLEGFMAGYNAFPNMWIKDENGELVYGGIQPEVKEALQVLQDMYQEGYIDPEFIFKKGIQLEEQISNGKIGMLYGEQWASFAVSNDPDASWKAFPIVSNDQSSARVPINNRTHYFWVVRHDYEYPEAILKMINLHLEKNWGDTAEYEKYYSTPYPVWQLSPITIFPPLKNYHAFLDIEKLGYGDEASELTGEAKAIYDKINRYLLKNEESGRGWYLTYGKEGAFSILDQYIQNEQIMYDEFVSVSSDATIELMPMLYNLQLGVFQDIILGDSLSRFDEFIEDWYRLGGDKLTEEVNEQARE